MTTPAQIILAQAEAYLSREQRWQIAKARALRLLARADKGQFIQDPETGQMQGSEPGPGHGSGSGSKPSGGDKPATDKDKPAATGKGGKKKTEAADFANKDKIFLDPSLRTNDEAQATFLSRWNDTIGQDPEEFRQQFLGGVNATMRIRYDEHSDQVQFSGELRDENNNSIGSYDRYIDLDDKKAKSAYFSIRGSHTGKDTGKKVLAGNVAVYQQMGIEKVEVMANIDVGGYAWAKYGYVPTAQSWNTLVSDLRARLNRESGGGRGGRGGGETYTPESWEEISDYDQEQIQHRWARATHDDFVQSEVDNWRDSGRALEDAKKDLASEFAGTAADDWAMAALKDWREARTGEAVPFTDAQILSAIQIDDYESKYEDGRDDPEFRWDDSKLKEPAGYDPAQQTLPGIQPIEPHELLTEEMRGEIEKALTKEFNDKAESDAADMDPPSWIGDSVADYQSEYWDSMSDRDKYRWAEDNSELPEIEIESEDDEEEELPIEAEDAERVALLKLLDSPNPKSLWAIADSPRGKQLLLGKSWSGVLNLKDKDTMDRFNAYIGRK